MTFGNLFRYVVLVVILTTAPAAAGVETGRTSLTLSDADAGVVQASLQCVPGWQPMFGGHPGVMGETVRAFEVFDDGTGPALYIGGHFADSAGGFNAKAIVKWDGRSLTPLAEEVFSKVTAMKVFDDGTGSALYAAGRAIDGVDEVAKWDGQTWTFISDSFPATIIEVYSMAIFDDSSGPALYLGGKFHTFRGESPGYFFVASWDGKAWQHALPGAHGHVRSLAVFDDGSGPALYAAGKFFNIGGLQTENIAKWDGETWSPLGEGIDGSIIHSLAVFDSGEGPELLAGGVFIFPAQTDSGGLARWSDGEWLTVDGWLAGGVETLAVHDDGGGPAMFVGGEALAVGGSTGYDPVYLHKWDGDSWTSFPSEGNTGIAGWLLAMTSFDSGEGPDLYVGGAISHAGDEQVNNVARWDGSNWHALSDDEDWVPARVRAIAIAEEPAGADFTLYAGGDFVVIGDAVVNYVGQWNSATSQWNAMGDGFNGSVHALAIFDDGDGPALYAGGEFTTSGGTPAGHIAMWDAASQEWIALGTGANGPVYALSVLEDQSGDGPLLVAGGAFTEVSGVGANRIAVWDGSNWSALGEGVNDTVLAIGASAHNDDGTLYVGGAFTSAGGGVANHVASWNGSSWVPLGEGLVDTVRAIVSLDNGDVIAGHDFAPGGRVAKWDGNSWSSLGYVGPQVHALAIFDDGTGAALYAAQQRWDGSSWKPMLQSQTVHVLTPHYQKDDLPMLFYGGSFLASPAGDSHLAVYQGCNPPPPLGDLTGDGSVGVADLLVLLGAWGACVDCPDTTCPADLDENCQVDVNDLLVLLGNWG